MAKSGGKCALNCKISKRDCGEFSSGREKGNHRIFFRSGEVPADARNLRLANTAVDRAGARGRRSTDRFAESASRASVDRQRCAHSEMTWPHPRRARQRVANRGTTPAAFRSPPRVRLPENPRAFRPARSRERRCVPPVALCPRRQPRRAGNRSARSYRKRTSLPHLRIDRPLLGEHLVKHGILDPCAGEEIKIAVPHWLAARF